MALALGVTHQNLLTAIHTLTGTFISSGDNTYTTALAGEGSTSYTSSSSVPVTKIASGEVALSGGAVTIDLTALTGFAGETITFLGLKVQFWFFRNKSGNANKMSVTKGATNGYSMDVAAASWTVQLDPNASAFFRVPDTAPDVAAGAKNIDVAGTGSQALEYILIAG